MDENYILDEPISHMRSVCHVYTFMINYDINNLKNVNYDNVNTLFRFMAQDIKKRFGATVNDQNVHHGYMEYSDSDGDLIKNIEEYFIDRTPVVANILKTISNTVKPEIISDIFDKYELSQKLNESLPDIEKKTSKNKI